jgi:hypothetical protein
MRVSQRTEKANEVHMKTLNMPSRRSDLKALSSKMPHKVHYFGLESIIQVKLDLNGGAMVFVKR